MRKDEDNVVRRVEREKSHQVLSFFFTPVDEPKPGAGNRYAKASTHVPEVIGALRDRFGEDVLDVHG